MCSLYSPLRSLTVNRLKEIAFDENISLLGVRRKDEIIAKIELTRMGRRDKQGEAETRKSETRKAEKDLLDISKLPNELILEILYQSDYETIKSLSMTDKRINRICNDEMLWKNKLRKDFYDAVLTDEAQKRTSRENYKYLHWMKYGRAKVHYYYGSFREFLGKSCSPSVSHAVDKKMAPGDLLRGKRDIIDDLNYKEYVYTGKVLANHLDRYINERIVISIPPIFTFGFYPLMYWQYIKTIDPLTFYSDGRDIAGDYGYVSIDGEQVPSILKSLKLDRTVDGALIGSSKYVAKGGLIVDLSFYLSKHYEIGDVTSFLQNRTLSHYIIPESYNKASFIVP